MTGAYPWELGFSFPLVLMSAHLGEKSLEQGDVIRWRVAPKKTNSESSLAGILSYHSAKFINESILSLFSGWFIITVFFG